MIIISKKRTMFLIAATTTWGAIAVHQSILSSGTLLVPFFCSAWTTTGFRRHPWNNDNNIIPKRHKSQLFSLAAETTTPTPITTTNTTTADYYRDLFPASDDITNGTLQIDGSSVVHTLYYEVHGSGPLNALFLHGGPGAGCFPNHARFFDPTKYTVVLLDQRGAGKSTPRGCVQDNTLDFLVQDCERLRHHLFDNNSSNTVAPWDIVLGGSWGATLGLAYSLKHPTALRSLILRGVCALRPSEVDWLFGANGGSAIASPEAWKDFSRAVSKKTSEEDDTREALHAHYDCLFNTNNNTNTNTTLRLAAARSWMGWEMRVTASSSAAANNNNSSSNNNNKTNNPMVMVSSPNNDGGKWHFENQIGESIVITDQSPDIVASQLRRDIGTETTNKEDEQLFVSEPRKLKYVIAESMPLFREVKKTNSSSSNNTTSQSFKQMKSVVNKKMPLLREVKTNSSSNNTNSSNDINSSNNKTSAVGRSFSLPPDYVPAQAMLTCYYSVNDRFVMGNQNLLEIAAASGSNNSKTTTPKIIAIQGGKDPICPPDTALDLLQSLPIMELRIPLESGHSMYDPAIKHEIVQATDRLADEFLKEEQQQQP